MESPSDTHASSPPRGFPLIPVVMAVLFLNLLAGGWWHSRMLILTGENAAPEAARDMATTLRYIRNQYVDPGKIGYDNLRDGAIQGMLGGLDPFSTYFTRRDYVSVAESSRGEFGGIGVIISMDDGNLTVVRPLPEGPAGAAGLQAKDRIIAVNGEALQTTKLEDAVRKIKGEVGTTVDLTIYRPSTDASFNVTLERAIIPVPAIVDASFVADRIGFIRMLQFNEKTFVQLVQALNELGPGNMDGLVLDLRYNPGGLLTSAVDVCSLFLEPGQPVVSIEGRSEGETQRYSARVLPGLIPLYSLPITVLINGGSASAAEIVAGCLSDHKRAILVGQKSYGKGSVQTPLPLPSGGMLHLTTARYFTPSRRVIHNQGIPPDILVVLDPKANPGYYQTGAGAQEDPQQDLQLSIAITTLQEGIDAAREAVPPSARQLIEDTGDGTDTPVESAP